MSKMTVDLPTGVSESEARLELAISLFQQEKVSFGQARQLAGLGIWDFQQELGRRRIPPHYDVEEFQQDLATIERLGL